MAKTDIEQKVDALTVDVGRLTDENKNQTRRLDEIQKTVDLLYKHLEILEDMQGSIRKLQELQVQARVHQDNVAEDIKATTKESQFAVEDKVDEIKEDTVKALVEK